MKLLEGFADMEKRNKVVSDALMVQEAKHKKKKKIAQDEVSSVLNLRILFKCPIHQIASFEILMAASSSENTNTVDSSTAASLYELMALLNGKPELLEGDASIQDVLGNCDVGNPEVEVKGVGEARFTENDEFDSQQVLQNAVSENKLFCSQASDLGTGMARIFCEIPSEFDITEEARQGDGARMFEPLSEPHYVEEDQEQSAKAFSGSATATALSQLKTPNAKSKTQEWKIMQASGPSSLVPGLLNSTESFDEAGGSLSPPSGEAAFPQNMAIQDMINQLLNMERELRKPMTMMVTVPITEEGERLEETENNKKEEAKHEKMKKIAQDDVSSVLNVPILFSHPIHLVTPSELLMAASSSESTNTVDGNTASLYEVVELVDGKPELLEGDAKIKDVLVNSDLGKSEVEVNVVGEARSTQNDEFDSQWVLQNAVSENKLFCSQAPDLGIGMAWNFCEIPSEFYITEEARQGDSASMFEPLCEPHYVEEDHEQSAKVVSGSATATASSQLSTPNEKLKNQEWKIMQSSGPSSSSPGLLNSVESFNGVGGSSISLSGEAAFPQNMAIQGMISQLLNMERELRKPMTMMVTVPITEEGERLDEAEHNKKEEAKHGKMKKIARDEVSSVLSVPIVFKHPIHLVTPSELLMTASSESINTVDSNTASLYEVVGLFDGKPELLEGDARIQDVLVNYDMGGSEVEVNVLGEARSTQNDEFDFQRVLQSAVSEKKFFCSQASDLEIGMAWNFCEIPSEFDITEEARQGDGVSMFEPLCEPHYVEEDQEQSAKVVSGSATATTLPQLKSPNAKSKNQEWKIMQASGPSSLAPGLLNSVESFDESGSSSPRPGEAAFPQNMAIQDMINQLLNMERELRKPMTMMVTVPITEEGERLEEAEHNKKEEAKHEKMKEIAQDEVSSVPNVPILFKHPIHLVTPSELLMAASSSESTNTVDGNTASLYEVVELVDGKPELLEGDAKIEDVLVNCDVGNPEVEVKGVGEARFTQNDEFDSQQVFQNAVSENKLFCSQASDLGIGMTRNSCEIPSEFYVTEDARQGDSVSIFEPLCEPHYVEEDQEQSAKLVSGSATATTSSQLNTSNAISKNHEWTNSQALGPFFLSPGLNSIIESSDEAGGISSSRCGEAAVLQSIPQIMAMKDMMNPLMNMQRELQKQMAMMVTVPITERGERLGKEAEHKKKKKNIAQEVFSVLSPRIMLMELLEGKPELLVRDARIQDVLVNNDVGKS